MIQLWKKYCITFQLNVEYPEGLYKWMFAWCISSSRSLIVLRINSVKPGFYMPWTYNVLGYKHISIKPTKT